MLGGNPFCNRRSGPGPTATHSCRTNWKVLKGSATCQTQNGTLVPGFVRETQATRRDPSLPQGERAVSAKLEFKGKTATGGGSTAT